MTMLAGSLTMIASAGPAPAGTSEASTLTASGSDATAGSTADSATGTAGTTRPGDAIDWMLHYRNETGAPATVNLKDRIAGDQSFVPGSLKLPPGLAAQNSTDGGGTWAAGAPPANAAGVGATGTVPAGTTNATSPAFKTATLDFKTPGGDGYSVEGLGSNIYTVFHHDADTLVAFCATLGNAKCSGWPAISTYVDPVAGTAIGTGKSGQYVTAGENGSFIANGNLYWGVEAVAPVDPQASVKKYEIGVQCLNLTALTSCGFTLLDTTTNRYGTGGKVSTDGIPAADGNYYFFAGSGNMLCFNPTTGKCGSVDMLDGRATVNASTNTYNASFLTAGRHIFVTFVAPGNKLFISCYDTTTAARCDDDFPIAEGTATNGAFPDTMAPVLTSSGVFVGACDLDKATCYKPTGDTVANPYPGIRGISYPTTVGFGDGVIVGSRFYAGRTTDGKIQCWDFSMRTGDEAVPACNGFDGPKNSKNYTTRQLANLPGCMASNGDAGVIQVFNEKTGKECVTASTQLALKPADYYCGQPGHARNWGTLKLNGVTGSEYGAATVTVSGVNGPVPGYTNRPLQANETSFDLSALPVSDNTASLTAQVTLTGVSNPSAVNAATMTLSWVGDPIELCFQTTVANLCPAPGSTVDNAATVVTSGTNGVTDGPDGTASGKASFTILATAAQCALSFTKAPSQPTAKPGDTLSYAIVVSNTGTAAWPSTNPAVFSDDLSDVLTDAAYNNDVSATAGMASYATPKVIWNGPLPASGSATITYSVTVNRPAQGPHSMVNTVTPNCPSYAACNPPVTVTVPIASYTLRKTVSRPRAAPGDTVTYAVAVTNTGQVPYTASSPATFTDDLSGLLADATYNQDVSATAGSASYAAPVLSWSGPVPVGGTATVTYSVTVKKPDSGPHRLSNVVTSNLPEANCQPSSSGPECVTTTPIASLQIVKTADRSEVIPGAKVTYTITATNTGQAAYTDADPASFRDDLSGIFGDADYNNDATASAGKVSYGPPVLSWSGPIPVGGKVTVTYSATVKSPDTGPHQMLNTVTSDTPGSNCPPGSDDFRCRYPIPTPGLQILKTASKPAANPGDTITYTVALTNSGKVPFTDDNPASFTDDLSGVLDDATYNNDATNDATYTAPALRWSGPLAVGQSVTITYSVKIKAPDTGDKILANVVTTPRQVNGNCVPPSDDPHCRIDTPVASYSVTKRASDASVAPGDRVTYTITVENTGKVDYTAELPASFADDLSSVLDDAAYNDDATNGAIYTAPVLRWAGPVAIGKAVTVTYSITVASPLRGDGRLDNIATTPSDPRGFSVGGCAAGAGNPSCRTLTQAAIVQGATLESSPPAGTPPLSGTLPRTGRDLGFLVLLATFLSGAGAAVRRMAHRPAR